MKNIVKFLALILIVTACQNQVKTSNPTLKNENDSLNYAYGVALGGNFRQQELKDSADKKISAFLKGLDEGFASKPQKNAQIAEISMRLGSELSQQKKSGLFRDSLLKLNYPLFKKGFTQGLKKEKTEMSREKAMEYLNKTMMARQTKKMEAQYGEAKKKNEQFLAENAKKPNIKTTPSGLQYEIIKAGTGAKPTATDKVKVHYHGTLIDGKVFDSSVERKQPAEFFVNQVIPGWTEALQMMPVGSKWKIYVPQNLAYGSNNQGAIPPFSTLIFEVELLEIVKK